MKSKLECALCGCKKTDILSKYGILEKSGPIIPFINVICKKCGLVFISPQPNEEEYKSIYSKYEKNRHLCQSEDNANEFIDNSDYQEKANSIYQFVSEFLNSEKSVLDIGAGFGQVVRGFQKYCKISAVEPSEVLSKIIRERFGTDVFTGDFNDFLKSNNKKFDLLIMHHVFEHFTDPENKLEQFKQILTPNGVIYIEVPDISSFKKPVYHFFDYMHPFSYSPKTIKKIIYKNNYKIIKVNKNKKYRLQIIIAPNYTDYNDIGSDSYWRKGGYLFTYYFIKKRKLIDILKKNYVSWKKHN